MNNIRLLGVSILQKITSVIQIKGVPKLIIFIKKALFRNNQPYKVYHGITITIDPNVNFHCLNVLNYGGYETIKLFEKYLKKGSVYIDIGGNLGYMCLNAEKIVGRDGKVIVLEPDPKILPILKENISLNNSSITLLEKAASEKAGIERFNIATESGLSRLDNAQQNLFGMELFKQKEVETDTLDNIIEELIPGSPVDMIKIDVEGHELRILKGAINTLRNHNAVLVLEINHGALKQNNVSYLDIFNFLEQFSYKFYFIESHNADWFRIGRNPTLRLIDNYHEKYIQKPFDLLCIKS